MLVHCTALVMIFKTYLRHVKIKFEWSRKSTENNLLTLTTDADSSLDAPHQLQDLVVLLLSCLAPIFFGPWYLFFFLNSFPRFCRLKTTDLGMDKIKSNFGWHLPFLELKVSQIEYLEEKWYP